MAVAPAAAASPLTVASPALFAAAAVLALAAVGIMLARRAALPRGAIMLMSLGLACVCLAAGGLTWHRRGPGHVAVIVDVSPSMRASAYHDRRLLEQRVGQLLGRTRYTLYHLADGVAVAPSQVLTELPEQVNANQTTYAP